MSSFFSRKRHTPQPAPNPTPAPAPAPNPPPALAASNQGSYGRSNVPPQAQQRPPQRGPPEQAGTPTNVEAPGRPMQQLAGQPLMQQHAPTQQTLPGQSTPQQQPPPGTSQPPSSGSGGGSSRPRQDYPWSVRRLRLESPLALPGQPGQTSVTSMTGPPLPRYGHSVPLIAAPNGEIFVFGGLVKDEVKDDLWMIAGVWPADAPVGTGGRRSTKDMGVTASLVETTGDAPGPRVGHKSALVSSVLIVWGGDTVVKDGDRNDDGLYLLNLSTRDWTKVSIVGQAPLGRYGHAVGMCGNKFMMFGGQVDGEFLNDLWCFDLQSLVRGTSAWEQLTPIPGNEPPPRRTGHVLVTYENKIYIFGGTDGAFHYNDTWVFDLVTRTWTELTCIGFIPVPREGHAAALVGDVMYVFGGRGVDGKDLGDLGSFKISNQRWYMFQNMGPQPSGRSGHAMATADGRMFVIGGESGEPSAKDDSMMVHVLDTNLIKYPESKPAPPNQAARRPNGAPTAPNGGAPPQDPRRGQGSVEGSQRGPGSVEGGPRAASAGHNGSSSPEEHRRGTQSADEQHRRGAQSVDEPKRVQEEMKRGAQSVDEPRRGAEEAWRAAQAQGMPEELRRVQEDARRTQGTPEDARRMGSTPDEARRLGGTPDEARRLQDDRRSQGQPSPDEARRLAASPPVTGRVRSPNGGSVGQSQSLGVATVGAGAAAASPPREVPPPRPPRRSDVESTDEAILDRSRSPPSQTQPQAQEQVERARSPQERGRSPAEALRAKSPINMAAVAMRGQGGAPGSRSGSPADVFGGGGSPRELNGIGGHARSGSAVSARGVVASNNLAPGDELETLRRRDAWLSAALARAANAGFVWADSEGDVQGDWGFQGQEEDAPARLADLVMGLKQNQARLQTTFAAQLQSASDRLIEADRVKTAAMQEAAFCRAKLAAYESNNEGDPAKLERDRSENLERLLSAASTQRAALERELAERTEALALQTQLREQAEEQAAETIRRAEMAEEDKERTLAGHAELMDRNVFLESSMRDHAEKIVAVQSSAKQSEAEHAATLQRLEEVVALRDEHLRALEQTQTALAATSARADDLERQWERSRQLIQSLEAEQADMRAELEQRTQETQSAVKHLEEVENAWAKSRQEADAHRHATTSSLGTILDSHKELRADEDRATRGHAEKVHAMEMELSSLRKMLKEAGNRIGESQSDLVVHQKKAGAALADAAALRAQLGGLRAQLAVNVAEHGRLKQELAMKEAAVRERASAASSAEVRLGMLRKYLADNGIFVDDEDISPDSESRGGTIRVQQLENELRERLRLHQDTERELQEVHRRRDDAEAQVQHLAQQLERAKSAASPSEPDTEGRVASAERRREETETRLNKRIQELDNDYQMAVKYVKGTEKMMRRMKEDYAKSKALNEKLQSELDVSRGITSSEAGSRTRGATGRNTPLSDDGHDSLRGQLVESQRSLQRLTADRNELKRQLEALQRDLEQSREDLVIAQNESSEREVQIEELEAKIEELQHSLSLARNGSDETVVERLTSENAALRREKDLLSHKVHILLDDQGGYGQEGGRPISGISRPDSQTSTENGMTQFDSFEDWQQRVNSRTSTNPRDSEYEPSTSHAPHERTRSGA